MSNILKWSLTLLGSFLLMISTALAEPDWDDDGGGSTATKAKPEIKQTFKVQSNSVTSDLKVEKSTQWKALMQAYPAQQFFKRIKGLPGIENILFTPGTHTVDPAYYDKEVVRSKRTSSLMIRVRGAAPFSMLFKVDEVLSRCKSMVASTSDSEEDTLNNWGSPDWTDKDVDVKAPCKMEASMKVNGPVAVYGTIPGNFSNRSLLMNQLSFTWAIKTSYDKEDTELTSSFKTERADFPLAIRKVLKWTQGSNLPYAELFFTDPQRSALVQVGRVLREKNQEILRGQ